MTDNCDELRESLLAIWPNCILLLCIFHILQQVWRWVHNAKNQINILHRPHILTKFKQILYANYVDEMEEKYETFMYDDVVRTYVNLISYIETVYQDREAWALCYRKELPIRGNNTNNFCEAQFLVLKDDILKRQKEVNIVGLLNKLTNELEHHYKTKLLSISTGKYDGIYSRRFNSLGKSQNRKEGIGFQIPTQEEQEKILGSLARLGNNNFLVGSVTSDNQYLVDMNSGLCQCYQGINGSPCKHQYILWASRIADSLNFIPRFSPEQKKMFSELAIGCSMEIYKYEGIHDRILGSSSTACNIDSSQSAENQVDFSTIPHVSNEEPMRRRDRNNDNITLEEAWNALDKATSILKGRIKSENQQCLRGIMKFCERVENFPLSKLTSGFHSFASSPVSSTKITAATFLKKAKGRKIFTQPTAVQRRRSTEVSKKNVSRNK